MTQKEHKQVANLQHNALISLSHFVVYCTKCIRDVSAMVTMSYILVMTMWRRTVSYPSSLMMSESLVTRLYDVLNMPQYAEATVLKK